MSQENLQEKMQESEIIIDKEVDDEVIIEKEVQQEVEEVKPYKIKHFINLQKGSSFFYVLFLMVLYQNFNTTSCVYLSLHGTYGFLWLLKDRIFPDKNWEETIQLKEAIISVVPFLLSYWISPYYIVKNHVEAGNLRLFISISSHTFGCVFMMASDTQKYFQLLEGKKLISNGWFSTSRNMNYFGEMLIYFPYALLGNAVFPYLFLIFTWCSYFYFNMVKKDIKIKKKEGGLEYIKNTNLLLPFSDEMEIKKILYYHYRIYTFHYVIISFITFYITFYLLKFFFS